MLVRIVVIVVVVVVAIVTRLLLLTNGDDDRRRSYKLLRKTTNKVYVCILPLVTEVRHKLTGGEYAVKAWGKPNHQSSTPTLQNSKLWGLQFFVT